MRSSPGGRRPGPTARRWTASRFWPPGCPAAPTPAVTPTAPTIRPRRRRVPLAAGTFEWIDTGDPMPASADTVVMREWVLPQEDGSVTVIPAVPGGKNVRRVGEDFAAGEVLVPAGRRLRPGDLAAAAAGGHASLRVARQPVVAIIPTGDEIRPPGSTARPGEILDTSSLMLAARCRQLSAVPMLSGIQPDDPDALAAEIRRCAHDADLVLIIAGSSRGRGDHAAAVLAQVGGVAVTGVAVRPGHPALLGHAKHPGHSARTAAAGRAAIAPVIGLPGYPLATTVIFELFAAPLLAALQGVRPTVRPAVLAALDRDWSSPPGIEDWVLVTLAPAADSSVPGTLPAAPTRRGAGSISQLARADAWWPIPADRTPSRQARPSRCSPSPTPSANHPASPTPRDDHPHRGPTPRVTAPPIPADRLLLLSCDQLMVSCCYLDGIPPSKSVIIRVDRPTSH